MSVRFAPSPTGNFHIGNLRTAWISHEFSRSLRVPWVVRFEDIDGPRVVEGAMEDQLTDMRLLGLVPDQVLIQSHKHLRHEALFRAAVESDTVYACTCSRKEVVQNLKELASAPHDLKTGVPVYDGRCREAVNERSLSGNRLLGWRFRNPTDPSGRMDFLVARTVGATFTPSYHWACAIDDFDGDHTLLVRASDLAHAAPFQREVFAWLGVLEKKEKKYPAIFHTALVQTNSGSRLEKRTKGVTLPELLYRGISVLEISQRLSKSFNRSAVGTFEFGKTYSEKPETISLEALGF